MSWLKTTGGSLGQARTITKQIDFGYDHVL
jgi:hypothetical protein